MVQFGVKIHCTNRRKYYEWSQAYQDQITVVYDTMWDGTKKLAHKLLMRLLNSLQIHGLRSLISVKQIKTIS